MSLRYLTPSDVSALVAYVMTVPPATSHDLAAVKASPAPESHHEGVSANLDPTGKEIYEGACASCHGWSGVSPVLATATLTGSRAVNDPTATNVVQVVLGGTARDYPHAGTNMPAFGSAYTDVEIAAVANYVTARFGSQPANITATNVAELRAQTSK